LTIALISVYERRFRIRMVSIVIGGLTEQSRANDYYLREQVLLLQVLQLGDHLLEVKLH
jgi:hypothetical protein